MAFYVFRWYCQVPLPSANEIAALRLRIFKTQKYKNIVKFTFIFLNLRQKNLILRFSINPFPYFWFLFPRFDDFKQNRLKKLFKIIKTSAANQIAQFVKTNACHNDIIKKILIF